ncbi:MAG: hypothetical protein KME23_13675 [Goleter apudmare HA4340-LM2]|nr:hypothetical protein [Goleter apudmare HA4340-LM2]
MNSWQKTVLENLLAKRFALLRWLMTFLLVVSLTSCGEKAVSQDVSTGYGEKPQLISKQFSEVSPPDTIQDLRSALEADQPQVSIVTPQPDEVLEDNRVTVRLQVKDLPIFQDPELELGPHLEVILDNQTYKTVYDLNQPLVLRDLSPGTHTLRVFASRPWDESFKNEGAYAQTTFHIFAKTDDNHPDPALPLLTYNSPKGDYGAEPILLDFYLTNAPLQILAQEDPNDVISDWRIRCTINGESFVFDRWQAIYLKGFKPGENWVKLEFLDNQGNPVKNAFNTTVRLINYQPQGQDTLSRIVRGELKADDVRSIVDPSYVVKIPPTQPTPEPTATATPQIPPQVETPAPTPKPTATATPQIPPQVETPAPTPEPTATATPQIPPQVERQPIPEVEIPETAKTQPAQPTVTPTPTLTPEPQPEVTPTPQATELPEKVAPKPQRRKFSEYFQRRPLPTVTPSPTLPEIIEPATPAPEPETSLPPAATPLQKNAQL